MLFLNGVEKLLLYMNGEEKTVNISEWCRKTVLFLNGVEKLLIFLYGVEKRYYFRMV